MARKTKLPHDEIARRAVEEAGKLAAKDGLRSIAMRPIAKAVGCSVGTIYNVVGDLDEIVLRLNMRSTTAMADRLEAAVAGLSDPLEKAHALAQTYVRLGEENQKLWSVLIEFSLPEGRKLPEAYAEIIARPVRIVEQAIGPLFPNEEECRRAVAALWAGLHGIVALSVGRKLWVVTDEASAKIAETLIDRYLGAA